jgi:chemotaxis protein MotB
MIKPPPEEKDTSERWLISYADFITLLMVFFVVMYAMSKVDAAKYAELSQSLNSAFHGGASVFEQNPGTIGIDDSGTGTNRTPTPAPTGGYGMVDSNGDGVADEVAEMQQVEEQLKTYFGQHNLNNSVSMDIDDRGLVVSLKDTILFDVGSADIRSDASGELVTIGEALNTMGNYIRVEGHTDNVPINTSRYSSNWELSAARAINVVKLFIASAQVPPDKLSAVGYGPYKPIADNSTAEGRSQNRRVDVILLSSRYNDLEENTQNASQNP